MREGYTINDALLFVTDDTPKLLYEKIYSEVIDYVINERFKDLTDNLTYVSHEQYGLEKGYMEYLFKIKDEKNVIHDKSDVDLSIEEINRAYIIEVLTKEGAGYEFSFSNLDLNNMLINTVKSLSPALTLCLTTKSFFILLEKTSSNS